VRHAAHATKTTVTDDVLPAIVGALGSAAAAVEVARDKHLRHALREASKAGSEFATKAGRRMGVVKPKPSAGRYFLVGVGVVALAALAYAAWQTFRPDDDLWVEDELDDLELHTVDETAAAI
jgi:hypothetical protein